MECFGAIGDIKSAVENVILELALIEGWTAEVYLK